MGIDLTTLPNYRPYTNIQPFTVRDGATYLLVLEGMREWLRDILVPHVDKEIGQLAESWAVNSDAMQKAWAELSAELIGRVDAAVASIESTVDEAKAAREAAEAARDLAAIYASQAEEFQDTAIAGIFNDFDSNFRSAFDAVLSGLIKEDPDDEGTFIITVPEAPAPPVPGNITPDPDDPGFFH